MISNIFSDDTIFNVKIVKDLQDINKFGICGLKFKNE